MRVKATITSETGRRIIMTATPAWGPKGGWRPVITDHKSGFTIDYNPPPAFDGLRELRFEVADI